MLFFSAHTGKQSNNSAALLCDQLITWVRYIDKSITLLTKSYISDQVNLPLVVHAGLCLTWLKTPDMSDMPRQLTNIKKNFFVARPGSSVNYFSKVKI